MENKIKLAKALDRLHQQHYDEKRKKKFIKKAIELSLTVILIGGFIWLIK